MITTIITNMTLDYKLQIYNRLLFRLNLQKNYQLALLLLDYFRF